MSLRWLRGALGWLLAGAVIAAAVAVIGLVIHAVSLQISWKDARAELAGIFSAARSQGGSVEQDGQVCPLTADMADRYFDVLLHRDTQVTGRDTCPAREDSIVLHLPEGVELVFTSLEDGLVNLTWTQDGSSRGYTLRPGVNWRSLCRIAGG